MAWNRLYIIKSYIRGSLWLVPFIAVVLYGMVSRATQGIGDWLLRTGRIDQSKSFLGLDMAGARTFLETVVTLNISFLVFTFGSLLVAIQVAGGQYTPRIIATTLLRDNAIRFTVGYFVFTMLFAVRVLGHLRPESDLQFSTFVALTIGAMSIIIFLYLIDYAARMLRPGDIAQKLGEDGIAAIESIYPQLTDASRPVPPPRKRAAPERIVAHAGPSGVVLAVHLTALVERAQQANGIIEFVPQVGDFVAKDEPLYRLYGGATAIDDQALRELVALGPERTIEQDPTFALRILVDIAIKALSPAINDPTTAVVTIDQLHRLLRFAGLRHLRGEEILDAAGEVRVVYRTPNWEDFVNLSCAEIRHYGAGSIQTARRMRSLLENLILTLPAHRHAELRRQLVLLDRAIDEQYSFAEDRALARIPDSQGLGGSLGVEAATDDGR